MKKRFYFIALFLSITTIASGLWPQEKTFMQRVTLEAGGGYALPVAPSRDNVSLSDYAGFRNFYVGANYAFTDLLGLRLSYGNNGFKDSDDSSLGLTHHKFMAEATFNIIEAIQQNNTPFEVMVHGGAGMALGKSKQTSGSDKMGAFQVGVMPQFYLTDNIRIHLDATYVISLKQDYYYDGTGMDDTGQFLLFNLGIGYSF